MRGASNGSTTGSMIHFILHLINEVQLLKTKMQRLWVIIEQTPFYVFSNEVMKNYTRMHSSGMRTVRNSSRLLGGGCLFPGWGVSALGGACSQGGGCLLWGGLLQGGGIPACTEADPPCGQTDRCKNITFATSLRTVTRLINISKHFTVLYVT